jgi:hypothetical protein
MSIARQVRRGLDNWQLAMSPYKAAMTWRSRHIPAERDRHFSIRQANGMGQYGMLLPETRSPASSVEGVMSWSETTGSLKNQ